MTSTTTAASNGSTTDTAAPAEPERLTGMARVREAQTYHTVSVLRDAMTQADRLCDQIHHAVSGAYFKDLHQTRATLGILVDAPLGCAVQTALPPATPFTTA